MGGHPGSGCSESGENDSFQELQSPNHESEGPGRSLQCAHYLESKRIRDAISRLNDSELFTLSEKLHDILAKMGGSAKHGDPQKFIEQDDAFHRAITLSTRDNLLHLWDQCSMRNWFLFSARTDADSLKQPEEGHQRICRTICIRDPDTAVSTPEEHQTSLMEGFMAPKPSLGP